MSAKQEHQRELQKSWTKGCVAPSGYVDWHRWAEAQSLHGLSQAYCVHCKRYYFPQEYLQHRPGQMCKVPE